MRSSTERVMSPNQNFITPARANKPASRAPAVRPRTISAVGMGFAPAADGGTIWQTFERRSRSLGQTSMQAALHLMMLSRESFPCLTPTAVIGQLGLLLCRRDRVVALLETLFHRVAAADVMRRTCDIDFKRNGPRTQIRANHVSATTRLRVRGGCGNPSIP